jgi:predicted protein tyrosine phosphatase
MANIEVTICGLDELVLHRQAGLTHVVSILDPAWPEPAELDFCGPQDLLRLRFHDIIDDWGRGFEPPGEDHVARLLAFGRGLPSDGPVQLLVHCHAGVSRSTAAAILLLAQREPARDPYDIVAEIAHRRPQAWPNLRIIELGDRLLNRDSTLVEAARRHYRRSLAAHPDLAEQRRAEGRGREVDG